MSTFLVQSTHTHTTTRMHLNIHHWCSRRPSPFGICEITKYVLKVRQKKNTLTKKLCSIFFSSLFSQLAIPQIKIKKKGMNILANQKMNKILNGNSIFFNFS